MVYKHKCAKHKCTFNCFKIDIYSIPESKTGSVNVTLNIYIIKNPFWRETVLSGAKLEPPECAVLFLLCALREVKAN